MLLLSNFTRQVAAEPGPPTVTFDMTCRQETSVMRSVPPIGQPINLVAESMLDDIDEVPPGRKTQ